MDISAAAAAAIAVFINQKLFFHVRNKFVAQHHQLNEQQNHQI